MKFINKLLRDEAGATAIEYGLIAALIAVAAITAMNGLGNQLKSTFNSTSSAMSVGNPPRPNGRARKRGHRKGGGAIHRPFCCPSPMRPTPDTAKARSA
jgi:pilus assembly protein Flp/PilA